ncbi:hypothetical protein CGLO_09679 [Colletotrichum gloeosporioides Cg-14]|nr:hypothetical protein CGLO_09679 [Colletotrichum gloeosporioides Cg-14]
MILHSYI